MNQDFYRVTSTGDTIWRRTQARTLRGAKIAASRYYQEAHGGALYVALVRYSANGLDFERCAKKPYGAAWITGPGY